MNQSARAVVPRSGEYWTDQEINWNWDETGIGRVMINHVMGGVVSYIKVEEAGTPMGAMGLEDFLRWFSKAPPKRACGNGDRRRA